MEAKDKEVMSRQVPMTPAQALTNAIFLAEESADTDIKVWRNDMLRTIEKLKQLKQQYEGEDIMLQRTKGDMSLPTSFRQLNATNVIEELNKNFTMLTENVVHSSNIADKPAAIQLLVDEYSKLVTAALGDKAVKVDGAKVLNDAAAKVKAMFGGQRVETPKKKRNPFYANDAQVSFTDALFRKNGKVK